MFEKVVQLFSVKIEVARGRSTLECIQRLREAYGHSALPYSTVARWVKAFREGGQAVQDNFRTGRPPSGENTIQFLVSLLDADRRWTARELPAEVGICHKTLLHILGYRKIAASSIYHGISEV